LLTFFEQQKCYNWGYVVFAYERLGFEMESRRDFKRQQKKKPKRFLKIFSVIILLLVLGGGAYAYYAYDAIKATAGKMHLNLLPSSGEKTDVSNGKPINILLLGVDERPGDVGRSDTMIVVTMNPKTKSMLMTSIPRDTRTEIVGYGEQSKINSAYAHGGVGMSMKTVENFLNIKIDYVTKINMEGLVDLVDAVGGITVDNKIDWYDEGYYKKGYHYRKGKIHLDGAQALGYARMRHLDPRGDIGRNERQRQVITAIVEKGKSLTSVTHMESILNAVGKNVKTNLTFDDMKTMVGSYRQCRDHIYDYEVQGDPQMINGGSYIVVSDEEKQKVHDMIQAEKDGTLDMSKYKNTDSSTTNGSSGQ
jgi:polyisoprenyl-teichoic acid--peptidoglycan teichoic acid transferase